jgi:hypothetical protein
MAKDKEGHGSEAHREGHKPQVEYGNYEKGSEFHASPTNLRIPRSGVNWGPRPEWNKGK